MYIVNLVVDYKTFVGNLNKANVPHKLSFKNSTNIGQKRYSYNSKENTKGFSQFNLNGLITLGGNSLFNSKKNSFKDSHWNKNTSSNQNLAMNNLKKNFSSKQKVFYSSIGQYNLKMNNNLSHSQKYPFNSRHLKRNNNSEFGDVLARNIKKRNSEKNIISTKRIINGIFSLFLLINKRNRKYEK